MIQHHKWSLTSWKYEPWERIYTWIIIEYIEEKKEFEKIDK